MLRMVICSYLVFVVMCKDAAAYTEDLSLDAFVLGYFLLCSTLVRVYNFIFIVCVCVRGTGIFYKDRDGICSGYLAVTRCVAEV
jgi:hypothetical protein